MNDAAIPPISYVTPFRYGANLAHRSYSKIKSISYDNVKNTSLYLAGRVAVIAADFYALEGVIIISRLALSYISLFSYHAKWEPLLTVASYPVRTLKDVCCAFNWVDSIQVFFSETGSLELPRSENGRLALTPIFGFFADVCDAVSFCQESKVCDLFFLGGIGQKAGSLVVFALSPISTFIPIKAFCNLVALGNRQIELVRAPKINLQEAIEISINIGRTCLILAAVYLENVPLWCGVSLNILNFAVRHFEAIYYIIEIHKVRKARLS